MREPATHPIRYRLEWLALITTRLFARMLPVSIAPTVGAGVGWCIMMIWSRRRVICRQNLARAFPKWTPATVDDVSKRVFQNFGRTTFEILKIDTRTSRSLPGLVDAPPLNIIQDAAAQGKGVLLLSGHIGNWELFAGWLRASGHTLDVVVKPMRNVLSDNFYNDRRRDLGVGIIHTQVATRGLIQAIRNKHLVAILADQYAGEDGVEVTFFGRNVSTPRGPAVLALKFGCPILSGAMVRTPDGRFKVLVDEPLVYQPTGDEDTDVLAITQMYTTRLEQHIRAYPDQWLWTHRRWRD